MNEPVVEVAEPARDVVEVVEDNQQVLYIVEPAPSPVVPHVLADLDDVADELGFDGQVLGLVDGVWTPVTPTTGGGGGGGLTLEQIDALFPRTSEVDAALAAGLAGKENAGTAAAAVLAHTAASNPHPGYVRPVDLDPYATDADLVAGLAGKADSVHEHAQSDVTGLAAALAGKEDAGAAAAAVSAHTAAADPHPQYLTTADGDARYGNLFKEAEQDDRLNTLEARPVIDSPDDIGAQPAGDYATSTELTSGLSGKADVVHGHSIEDVAGLAGELHPAPVTLVDQATIATDAAQGTLFRVTLGGNRTLGAPANPTDGQRVLWEIVQDGTGGRALALASGAGGFAFGSDVTAFAPSTGAGKRDFVGAIYIAALDRWLVIATAKGY